MIVKADDKKIWTCTCNKVYHSLMALDQCYLREHRPIVKPTPRPKEKKPIIIRIKTPRLKPNKIFYIPKPKCKTCRAEITSRTIFGYDSSYCESCKVKRHQKNEQSKIDRLNKVLMRKAKKQKLQEAKDRLVPYQFKHKKLKGECKTCRGLAFKHSKYCYNCKAKRMWKCNELIRYRHEMKKSLDRIC